MSLKTLIKEKKEKNTAILATSSHQVESVEEESVLMKEYVHSLPSLINMTQYEFMDIWREYDELSQQHRHRGPSPKFGTKDTLFVTLVYFSCYPPMEDLALLLQQKVTTLEDCVKRCRPILLQTLQRRWEPNRFRPIPIPGNFPYIALLLDATTIEVYKPKVRFEEAKAYYDGKNHKYGLKKEVAVMAAEPHYALFLQKGQIGSKHDYSILKQTSPTYATYTTKTEAEAAQLLPDTHKKWAILCDNGYQGPAQDTPDIRRIFVQRTVDAAFVDTNLELAKLRVPVECFFGRAKNQWHLLHGVYRGDHVHFDADVDICFLLTNEGIKNGARLGSEDQTFFISHQRASLEKAEEQARKRKNSTIKFKQNKKRKMILKKEDVE